MSCKSHNEVKAEEGENKEETGWRKRDVRKNREGYEGKEIGGLPKYGPIV